MICNTTNLLFSLPRSHPMKLISSSRPANLKTIGLAKTVLCRSLFFSVFCSKAYQTIFSQHNFWRNYCAWQALRGELFRMPPERVQQDSLVSFSWIQMKTFLKLEFRFGYAAKKVRVGLLELPVSWLLVLWSDFFILVNCWWLVSFI